MWKRILPRSGFGNVSPEMTSSNNMSLSPLRKSSSMLSIAVPAFLKWLLHQAVNVCGTQQNREKKTETMNRLGIPTTQFCNRFCFSGSHCKKVDRTQCIIRSTPFSTNRECIINKWNTIPKYNNNRLDHTVYITNNFPLNYYSMCIFIQVFGSWRFH